MTQHPYYTGNGKLKFSVVHQRAKNGKHWRVLRGDGSQVTAYPTRDEAIRCADAELRRMSYKPAKPGQRWSDAFPKG